MSGIAGFCDYNENLLDEAPLWGALAKRMGNRLRHRGPDFQGTHVSSHAAFAHSRLAIVDIEGGKQPMSRVANGNKFTITYNGELYNAKELRNELKSYGYSFSTTGDTEVLLYSYIQFGADCAEKLNGMFAFAIDDEQKNCTFLCRDRFGIKPLFYTIAGDRLVFGSEIKALFEYPGVNPIIDQNGLCEIFGLGPARTAGNGVFKDIYELKPAHCGFYDQHGFRTYPYYQLTSHEHTDSYEETVRKIRELLEDIVARQLVSDVPLCSYLSGGLDSSIITAIAANQMRLKGKKLCTYSFDFLGNDTYFKPTTYQPDADQPWAQFVCQQLNTTHHTLVGDSISQMECLYDAVVSKDLPGMADVDSSLLYFCNIVKNSHDVALCGECADEIFGGYPWFHKEDAMEKHYFPWSNGSLDRIRMLKPEIAEAIQLEDYVNRRYEESIDSTPRLEGENESERRKREISYLNITWFMSMLLDRKDRAGMANGLEIRVPYADHRLVDYVFNTPWEYKCHNGVSKSLLRDAASDLLPKEILQRQKSPYPKTHNPSYEMIIRQRLAHMVADEQEPLHKLVDKTFLKELIIKKSDYGNPWFGQLMAEPQLMAYLIQINFWLKRYEIQIQL